MHCNHECKKLFQQGAVGLIQTVKTFQFKEVLIVFDT